MEWGTLYLVVPPAVAIAGAILGGWATRRSAMRIDRLQTQFDQGSVHG